MSLSLQLTMDAALSNHLTSLDEARALIARLQNEFQQARAQLQAENKLLRQKLDALARRLFGVSSEALNPAQRQLLLSLPERAAQPVENIPAPAVVEEVMDPAPQICSSHRGGRAAGHCSLA